MKKWIDPPSGWKYGFPKTFDTEKDGDMHTWLVANGYPQEEIEDLGAQFYVRQWLTDEEEEKCRTS
ncbi:MAG: hypothetical protein EBT26_08225 [Microbacteriaceae bacterium]|nr:hypothetical protein [Microbacteriaceae bacterium]